ncbi:TPA: DUF2513 domain-containing protein [Aeromonas hydrophila]
MKRDWDLIRLILTKLEEKQLGPYNLSLFHFNAHDRIKAHELSYNARLLLEKGLVEGRIQPLNLFTSSAPDFFLVRLTWEGHELLDAIRNETVWAKTKETFASKGLDITLDLVKGVATSVATTLLGLPS